MRSVGSDPSSRQIADAKTSSMRKRPAAHMSTTPKQSAPQPKPNSTTFRGNSAGMNDAKSARVVSPNRGYLAQSAQNRGPKPAMKLGHDVKHIPAAQTSSRMLNKGESMANSASKLKKLTAINKLV